jgi:hypothetical protein
MTLLALLAIYTNKKGHLNRWPFLLKLAQEAVSIVHKICEILANQQLEFET